jgi:hypothetical protein
MFECTILEAAKFSAWSPPPSARHVHKGLECQVSKLVQSDTRPRPTHDVRQGPRRGRGPSGRANIVIHVMSNITPCHIGCGAASRPPRRHSSAGTGGTPGDAGLALGLGLRPPLLGRL